MHTEINTVMNNNNIKTIGIDTYRKVIEIICFKQEMNIADILGGFKARGKKKQKKKTCTKKENPWKTTKILWNWSWTLLKSYWIFKERRINKWLTPDIILLVPHPVHCPNCLTRNFFFVLFFVFHLVFFGGGCFFITL